MNTTTLLSFGVCLMTSLLFSGCAKDQETPEAENKRVISESPLLQKISEAKEEKKQKALQKTAGLSLQATEEGRVELWLENPNLQDIRSLRSFLAYDATVLEGISLTIAQDSPFSLIAPDEWGFDKRRGIVSLGISRSQDTGVHRNKVHIATIDFKRKKDGFTTLDFFDVQDEGHTMVLASDSEGNLINILKTPSIPALILP